MPVIGALVSLLVTIVLAGVAWWAVKKILALFKLEEPFATLAYVVLVICGAVIVLYVLQHLLAIFGVRIPGFSFR